MFVLNLLFFAGGAILLLLFYEWARNKLGINTVPNQTCLPQTQFDYMQMYSDYREYLDALCDCVRGTYRDNDLERPCDFISHMAENEQYFFEDKRYGLVYKYIFERRMISSPLAEKKEYAKTEKEKIVRIINRELPKYCIDRNLIQVRIVESFDSGNKIIFWIARKV